MKTKTISSVECKRCFYEWFPRIDGDPKLCPRCKSPNWQSEKKTPKWAQEADK